jgi:hypothetical protein
MICEKVQILSGMSSGTSVKYSYLKIMEEAI